MHTLNFLFPAFLLSQLCFLPCSGGQAIAQPANSQTYLNELRTELKKRWPHNRTITIVCHGHSVPTGYFATPNVRPLDSYPHLLQVALRQDYPTSVTSVICTGIGGENSEQGARRFQEDVLAKKPDVVTLDYSLNDRKIGLERARIAWASMIEAAQAANVRVILLTPTPDIRKTDLRDPQDPLVLQSEKVRALADKYQVGLVDSLAAFLQFESEGGELRSLMAQSNHPNRQGHELVTDQLYLWFQPTSK